MPSQWPLILLVPSQLLVISTLPPHTQVALTRPVQAAHNNKRLQCMVDGWMVSEAWVVPRLTGDNVGATRLVNIALARGTAQKRVTGGRWRRIVLGDVLAGHVVELRGSPRLWPYR